MRARTAFALVLALTLAVRIVTALVVTSPGIGDPGYYDDVARAIGRGEGLTSRCLWNLLHLPEALPMPGCAYWGPGVPAIAGSAYALFGPDLRCAQAAMILVSLALSGVALALARRLVEGVGAQAMAGVLIAFHLQIAYFSVTVDTPVPFALFANLCLLPLGLAHAGWAPGFVLAVPGAVAAQLTRADGLLLPLTVFAFALVALARRRIGARTLVAAAAVYGLLVAPWLYRNALAFGTPFPSSALEGIALSEYSDLFKVHTRPTFARFLADGPVKILSDRAAILFHNLETIAFAENKFLFLLALLALPSLARTPLVLPYLAYFAALFFAMSFAFAYQSRFGSLLHSVPALFPLFVAAAVRGSQVGVERVSAWPRGSARRLARTTLAIAPALIALYSALQVVPSVIASGPLAKTYGEFADARTSLREWWDRPGVGGAGVAVMSNDSLDVVTMLGCPVVQEPRDPGLDTVFELAARYRLRYLIVFRSERWSVRSWDQPRYAHAAGELVRVGERPGALSYLRLNGFVIYEFRLR